MTQEIIFADDLFHDMYTGDKRFTIRRGRRDYILGECLFLAAQEPVKLNATARIVSLKTATIEALWPDECERYGYVDRLDLFQTIEEYYSGLTTHETITIVEFEIIEHPYEDEY